MKKVYFKTFGCRTNLFDTQVMKSALRQFECVENEADADIVVVNSCTVTNGADSGVRGYLRKMHTLDKKVYLTGCGVATKGDEIFTAKLAHGIFAHSFKENIDDLLRTNGRFFHKETNHTHLDSTLIAHFANKARAFIKIQEGCNFTCSYCIIPKTRGRARSYPKAQILEQIKALCDNGISEVVLSGTNVGSYGIDLDNENLASLIRAIDSLGVLKRLRIGSLEPSQIDNELEEALQIPLMERHLHIALQHTSDIMLNIMNRINRVESDLALFESFAKKGFCLGSDFIIAHPGESEEVWEEALNNFKLFPLTHLHPFIYSKRDGTASSMFSHHSHIHTPGNIAKERLNVLKNIIVQNNQRFRQMHPLPLNVLCESRIESSNGFIYSGLDQFFNRMHFESDRADLEGKWLHFDSYHITKEGNSAHI